MMSVEEMNKTPEMKRLRAVQIVANAEHDLGYTLSPGQRVDLILDNMYSVRDVKEARELVSTF